MARETDKNAYVYGTEGLGEVKIADDVVAVIAAYAAMEVEGVSAMAGNITNELMSKVGVRNLSKGVKVVLEEENVRVNLAILVEYGYEIPVISKLVQDKVKTAIENMTGLTVTDVNIRIAGVDMEKH